MDSFSASAIGIIADAQLYLPIGKLYCYRSDILLRKVIFTLRVSYGKYNITLTASQNITFRFSKNITVCNANNITLLITEIML